MNRENALWAFLTNIKQSWTWAKLTDREKKIFESRLKANQAQNLIQGTYQQRYNAYTAMYDMFLAGLGYFENGPLYWREEYIYEPKTSPNAKLEDYEWQINFYQKMVLGKKEVK